MRIRALIVAIGLVLGGQSGCSTYQDHLNRGQRYYDENEYEQAMAIWRALEVDMDSLSDSDQARYAYLRGMTDYRLGYRPYARHWLALGLSIDKKYPGGLKPEWINRANQALDDLNKDVFTAAQQNAGSTATGHPGDAALPAGAVDVEPSGGDSRGGAANPDQTTIPGSKSCKVDSDCPSEQACLAKRCVTP